MTTVKFLQILFYWETYQFMHAYLHYLANFECSMIPIINDFVLGGLV